MSESWNTLEDRKSAQLACTNPDINPQKWTETLIELDQTITTTTSDIIVISLPYTLQDTIQALHVIEYIDDMCMKNIISFIVPDQNFMQTMMPQNDESKQSFILNSNDPEIDFTHFDVSKYDELLSTQAMIIINIKECSYISIPRNVEHLSSEWYISWFGSVENETTYNAVFEMVRYRLPENFVFIKNWGKGTAQICGTGSSKSSETLRLNEWHFNTSNSKPHSVVLLHSLGVTAKSRRKVWVDCSEKYDNESTAGSFRIEIDKDVITISINHNVETGIYSYRLVINNTTFEDKLKQVRRKKMVSMGYGKKKVDLSKIYGKIQFVNHFPDYKVQIVNHFPDLKVQQVTHFPNTTGKWQIVNHFADYKIQIVNHFPDFKIQYVNHFPGVVKK